MARRTSTANSTSTEAGSSISDTIGVIRSSATKSVRRDQPSYAVAQQFQRVWREAENLTLLFESGGIAYEGLVVARAALERANRDQAKKEGIRLSIVNPPLSVSATDYHTAGVPFRIVSEGVEPILGETVLDKRTWAIENLDRVRRFMVYELWGHADMYGCFVTEPDDGDGDLGVLFFHNAGFSTACGHGTIALATWAIESGIVSPSDPRRRWS